MRAEVLEGAERRRRWSIDEKMRIVAETLQPGTKVTAVARRNRVAASLVFSWRRQARTGRLGGEQEAVLVPVQITTEAGHSSGSAARVPKRSVPPASRRNGLIEIDLGGDRRVRVDAHFDAEALSRVLDLLERR